ncbi:MAG: hypothetical protein ACI9CD_000363 [Candidatus Deianiraeaceae bacterium]|jgi:hypothetical protein
MRQNNFPFLSMWKGEGRHHCYLLPSLYALCECKLLIELFTFRYNLEKDSILASPDFLFYTNHIKDRVPLKVEHARSISSYAQNTSFGSNKIIVIEGIENASVSALNALLKITEEPPRGTVFYLLYSSINAIPATIKSRSLVISENITTQNEFSVLVKFFEIEENFELFQDAGYDFETYQELLSVQIMKFDDVFQMLNTKIDKTMEKKLFLFLEYQLCKIARKESDSFAFEKISSITQKISYLRQAVRVLNIGKQSVFIQLIEEVYALAS